MSKYRTLTPERLARSPSHVRLVELIKHLQTFEVFPSGYASDTRGTFSKLKGMYKGNRLTQLLTDKSSETESNPTVNGDPEVLLNKTVDRYIGEVKKFADCFDTPMLLDILHLVEPIFQTEIARRKQLVGEYEALDHQSLAEKVQSIELRIAVAEVRTRLAKSRPELKEAERHQQSLVRGLRDFVRQPAQLESKAAISGSVVARLGLFVRRLRARVAAEPVRCRLHTTENTDDDIDNPEELRRQLLKKLKRTKHVGFPAKPVVIRASFDSQHSDRRESLRGSLDRRARPTFKRSNSSYQKGKWADKSGQGYVNTSGFRQNDSCWPEEWSFEQPSAHRDDELEPLSPTSAPNGDTFRYVPEDPIALMAAMQHAGFEVTYETPPNSPQPGTDHESKSQSSQDADVGTDWIEFCEDQYRKMSDFKDLGASDSTPKPKTQHVQVPETVESPR